jgi:hypothetical protein
LVTHALCSSTTIYAQDTLKNIITLILTVSGSIQTDDPWTTGPKRVNEWAKPMYRIWFDTNGNPNDGAWDNGQGPRQAELWLDTGRLGFRWNGPDGMPNTPDDVCYWPLLKIEEGSWSDQGIEAYIAPDRKSIQAIIPLDKLGNPRTLEVSFMTSPWTTGASDNLGQGAYSRPAWIVIRDATVPASYSQEDPLDDNAWPNLLPRLKSNFDLVRGEITISSEMPGELKDDGSIEEQRPREEEMPSERIPGQETPSEEVQSEEIPENQEGTSSEQPAEGEQTTKETIVDNVMDIFKKIIKEKIKDQ